MKKKTYNDGIAWFYRKKPDNLTRTRNITSVEELDFQVKLAYSEMSKRQQDMEFAEQQSFSLSLKIKTMNPGKAKGIDNQCFAIIGNTLYGIKYIDSTRTELFFYLEKARVLRTEENHGEKDTE